MPYVWLAQALAALAGVEPHEVSQVLAAERRLPVAADVAGVQLLTIWGRTSAGRPLIVAVRREGEFDWRILGAREMTPVEVARFERWEAER